MIRRFASTKRYAAFASVALLGCVAGGTTMRVDSGIGASATVLIPPAAAASLIDATSGAQLVANRAVGDHAKLINASLPFSTAPVTASRPFDLSNSDPLDRRRALLCLTQAIYYEAGYEPAQGRPVIAVDCGNHILIQRHQYLPVVTRIRSLQTGITGL